MPVLSLACHLPHNTPNIPSRYNNEQTTKQTKAINNSYIYIYISCKCDTNRAGHFTLDAYASRPVACRPLCLSLNVVLMTSLNGTIFRLTSPLCGKLSGHRLIHWSRVNSPHKDQWHGAFCVFFDLCLMNERLSKQSLGWIFGTPSRSLWRHCSVRLQML